MPIPVQSKLKPRNNGNFPVVDAIDVHGFISSWQMPVKDIYEYLTKENYDALSSGDFVVSKFADEIINFFSGLDIYDRACSKVDNALWLKTDAGLKLVIQAFPGMVVLNLRTGELITFQNEIWTSSALGQAGKSAYQIWLDQGNVGSEADFLLSLKGADGLPGEQGVTGEPGIDGKSAYQIWLDQGNVGSEADFLLSLKGSNGEPGEQGVQGEQGEQGPAGEAFYDDIILATADSWTTKKSNGAIPFEEEDANTGHTRWTKLFSPATDQYICLEIRNLNNTLITTNKFNLIMTVKCNEVDLDNKTVGFECRAYYKKSNQPSGNWWTGMVSTKILTNALQDYRLSFNLVEFIDPVSYDDGCLVIEIKRKTDIQSNVPYDVFMVDTEIHLNK